MDVHYQIGADGQLQARNQVILKQLEFGERVDSPDATRLPVQLAVALLKDRQGVIDVDLPISGSINDPQFSLGGLVLKVIVNLLTKAITAPFALLSGGSDDLSQLRFAPGATALGADAAPALSRVAEALQDRPALHLTIRGVVDPAQERAGLQQAWLAARLQALAARLDPEAAARQPWAPAWRETVLRRLYEDTPLPDKPRRLLGLGPTVPLPEVEARLLAAAPLDEAALRRVAEQRAEAVRDALLARGLSNDRLFLAAPALQAGEGLPTGVALSLGTR